MVYTIEAYKTLLGFPGSYRLKNDGNWVANVDFHSIQDEDKLFKGYAEAKQWLNINKTTNINGQTVNTEKRAEVTLGERYFKFEIILHRQERPHMFTQQDVYDVLKRGDDSRNNILVIDVNGFPRLLSVAEYANGDYERYPVRLESYCAGNGYVGNNLSYKNVNDDYIMCLEGWLLHLQCGRSVRQDYSSKSEEELIEDINKELQRFN